MPPITFRSLSGPRVPPVECPVTGSACLKSTTQSFSKREERAMRSGSIRECPRPGQKWRRLLERFTIVALLTVQIGVAMADESDEVKALKEKIALLEQQKALLEAERLRFEAE